jgi:phage-related minor tail protein
MRLGQLSRKLDLSTSKIVTFIEKEFEVSIENHPNSKIDDSFLEKINNEFKVEPTPVEETPATIEETAPEKVEVVEEATPVSEPQVEAVEESIAPIEEKVTETTETIEEEADVEVELIKAPKPELKQIKVLRKIELPQKKKIVVEESTEEGTPINAEKELANLEKELKESIEKPAPVKQKKQAYKRPTKPMKKKKSVDEILAEKKKKEEKEKIAEEKRRQEKAEYEKQKRKEHYATQVANVKPKKKKKKKQTETITQKEKQLAEKDAPKSWIGKLVKWFQTS